ncbi:hypothetical protein F4802DRAFT_187319 [Xylaria palmicola]|nr:hypothetical protein F4802DRAFT_187319 [Xylaria palmicola]
MKFSATAGSLLVAATAAVAQSQCPIVWDDPRDEPGNPEYRNYDAFFSGTGRVHLRAGCTAWRQNYPRDLPDVPPVGCLNEDGLVVPIADDNCATFKYIPATGELEDYPVDVLRTAKNDWICAVDFMDENGKWACKEDTNDWHGDTLDAWDGDAPHYLSLYEPGVISTSLFTWWIKHPPQSTADAQSLEFRVPDNPYSNYTVQPGDGIFPVVFEFVKES